MYEPKCAFTNLTKCGWFITSETIAAIWSKFSRDYWQVSPKYGSWSILKLHIAHDDIFRVKMITECHLLHKCWQSNAFILSLSMASFIDRAKTWFYKDSCVCMVYVSRAMGTIGNRFQICKWNLLNVKLLQGKLTSSVLVNLITTRSCLL